MATQVMQAGGRWQAVTEDGRPVAGPSKTREAAERVAALRERQLADNAARDRQAREAQAAGEEQRRAELQTVWGQLRKVRSRDPGYAVNSLGDRCEAVWDSWREYANTSSGSESVVTVVVVMREGADLSGTLPLDESDM